MTQKFKIGDKVKVIYTKGEPLSGFDIGDEVLVVDVVFNYFKKQYRYKVSKGENRGYGGNATFELVSEKSIQEKKRKGERISALEQEVAELTAKVVALEKAITTINVVAMQITKREDLSKTSSDLVKAIKHKSPNDQRKVIIAEAKAFVEDAKNFTGGISGRKGYKYASTARIVCDVAFHINTEKRTVVALLKSQYFGHVAAKGIAKCYPDDVFNADIGKAIALGRALGLDVSNFEQAVKPTEFTVGQVVTFDKDDSWHKRHNYRIDKMKGVDALTVVFNSVEGLDYRVGKTAFQAGKDKVIIEDTDAQY